MDDLIARIRAALDEDARLARLAAWSVADHTYAPVDVDEEKTELTGNWVAQGVLGVHKRVTVSDPGWNPKVTDVVWREVGDHIVRHDPKRVLAMVAAHRAILVEHAPDEDGGCVGCGFGNDERRMVEDVNGCPMLLALAKGYGIEP